MTFEFPSLPGAVARRFSSQAPWARERLAAHAGKRFSLLTGPMLVQFRIAADGALEPVSPVDAHPDLTLSVTALDFPALLADPGRFRELVREEGDAAFARDLEAIAGTLPWVVERELEHAFGPIVGERMAAAGRALLAFPREAVQRLAGNVLRYAHDESDLIATSADVEPFSRAITEIAAGVESLAARIEALEARTARR